MAGHLGACGELGAHGEVMYPPQQPRSSPHSLLAEPEPVARRCEAVDERQDLPAAFVHSKKPRRAAEPAALEVGQQPVNPARAGVKRPAYGVADAHHPGRVAIGERDLPRRATHYRITAPRLPNDHSGAA